MQLFTSRHQETSAAIMIGIFLGLVSLFVGTLYGAHVLLRFRHYPEFISKEHALPVITLTMAESPEWNNQNYTGEKADKNWSTLAQIHYYQEANLFFETHARVQLHGDNLLGYPQKSFRLTFSDEHGNEQPIKIALFDEPGPNQFGSLVLRNDDSPSAHLREQVAAQLVSEATELDVQRGKPVVLYINGQYWGLYFLRERFDETYFREKYLLRKNTLGLVEIPLDGNPRGHVVPSNRNSTADAATFNTLLGKVAQCDTCASYSSINKTIDVDSLMDYLFFELYFGNGDWPFNNYKAWRYQTSEPNPPESELVPQMDGRFRMLVYDFDAAFGSGNETAEKMTAAAHGNPYNQLIDNAFPFRNIFFIPKFGEEYRPRVEQVIKRHLDPEHTDTVVDYWAAQIRSEMPRQIQRWKQYNAVAPYKVTAESMEVWEQEVELLKLFLRERPAAFLDHTYEFFYPKQTEEYSEELIGL